MINIAGGFLEKRVDENLPESSGSRCQHLCLFVCIVQCLVDDVQEIHVGCCQGGTAMGVTTTRQATESFTTYIFVLIDCRSFTNKVQKSGICFTSKSCDRSDI